MIISRPTLTRTKSFKSLCIMTSDMIEDIPSKENISPPLFEKASYVEFSKNINRISYSTGTYTLIYHKFQPNISKHLPPNISKHFLPNISKYLPQN